MHKYLFAGGLLAMTMASSAVAAKQPNILFILTDNQSAGLIGTYGNPDIKTPNIDRLADQGIKFTNAFAVNGMCSPTRATLMTGLMPSQHGLHDWLNDEEMKDWPKSWSAVAEFRSVPYTLKKNGYQTAMIGKWHLGQPWKPSLGFDYWMTFTSGHTVDFWKNTVIENGKVKDIQGQHMVDYFGDRAVDYLNNYKSDKPFFLEVSFDGPYMNPPTNMGPAKNRFYKDYAGNPLNSFPSEPVSKNYIDQLVEYSKEGRDDLFLNRIIKMVIGNMEGDHATRANMASQNTLVDDNVGRLLKTLEDKGLADDTIVIFTSDQGTYYGQHGLWTHTVLSSPATLQETALHIPLIVRKPGAAEGKQVDALIGQYDIPGTILALAGINQPLENSPGKNFADLLEGNKVGELHDAVFYEQTETRGIRTHEFAYWKRLDKDFGESELYDMVNDPEQRKNLIADPAYAAQVKELDSRLVAFFDKYSDPQYDLWKGGTAKGSLSHPDQFEKRYGKSWKLETAIKPAFSEQM
ncbi:MULTISPECIES: sulfatase-like hydrolase/transferase [Pseudomonas]|uniref:sulfatase-like hydrolase/transferase n=1 Tax=Pseudomonas TaxID=286 RepID=UPI000C10BEF1|nr:hypothetical protein [Pseudomonadaceae bacterium]HCP55423.1 hypothetical protein [Pseudomonas sp.]